MNMLQKYRISYPFYYNDNNKYYINLNGNVYEKLLSEILHVILTAKVQRIMMPNFGTDLIKYIFDNNDNITWENIENEIINSIAAFVPNAKLNKINILNNEEDNKIYIYLNYSVSKGSNIENNEVMVEL